jgi:hypothetical protein
MSTLRILSTGDPMQGERATQFASTRGATQYRVGFCSIREFKLRGIDYSVQCDVADSGTGPYFKLSVGGDVFKGLTPTAVVRDLCEFLRIDLIRPVAQFIGLNKPTPAAAAAAVPASPVPAPKRARGALDADPHAIVPSGPRSRRRAALSARKTTMMLLDHNVDDEVVDDDDAAGAEDETLVAAPIVADVVESPAADDDVPLSRRRRIVRDDGDVGDEAMTPTGDDIVSQAVDEDEEEFVSSRRGGSGGGNSRRGGSATRAPRKKTTVAATTSANAADQEGEQSGGADEEQYDAMAQSGQARSDGGLRSFASLVTRYVHSKAETTFADVADAVVGLVQSSDSIVNEHNARRRVYDVLNVLQSAGILRKEKKRVTWIGIDELNLGEAGKGDFVPEPIVKRVPSSAAAAAAAAASSSAPAGGAAQGGARAAAAAAAAAAVAAELAKRKAEVRARIAAKERRVEQLYYFRIRLQNVMNRNGAIERACELVGKSTRDVERLRVPFLLVSTAATAVVDCDATEDHSEVVLRLSHAFCIADESVTLEAMHEKGLILRR